MRMKFFILTTVLIALTTTLILPSKDAPAQIKLQIPGDLLSLDSLKIWIFLTDKGESVGQPAAKVAVQADALLRREKRGAAIDSDWLDRGVAESYKEQIAPHVLRVVQESRWLNAVSAWIRPDRLTDLAGLEFVREIRPVATFRRSIEGDAETAPQVPKPAIPFPPEYGPSWPQLNEIGIPVLHERGWKGEGIKILILDTGFRIDHEAFFNTEIAATRDFINGDDDVQDGDDFDQQFHGTATFSIIGGSAEGKMIGAAQNATYYLAKTEIYAQEIRVEEDYWVAGLEWGEQQGIDVASSSLGYTDWYFWHDMDGNTAVTTIGADIAASLGVIVVNAVGNESRAVSTPTLIAPSDGDSVIAVGAIASSGEIAHFSSNGPTYDGRIKPDVCARGVANYQADERGGYTQGSGTSYATPLVAGAVALLLQAHPEWKYGDVYRALTQTATRAADPDSVYGYGIVRAALAADYQGEIQSSIKGTVAYPNPFAQSVRFDFEVQPAGKVEIRIFTVAGEKVATLRREAGETQPLEWNGENQSGEDVAAGVYVAHIAASGIDQTIKLLKITRTVIAE